MKFNKLKSVLIRHERIVVFFIYLITFLLLFMRIINGVGQYWDWSFPYYQDQIHNVFDRNSSSWTSAKMGSPLSYTSDYYVNFIISLLSFFQPENLRYILLATLSTSASFGVYLISRRRLNVVISIVLGMLAILNPAIFYKFTAGHFDYFVSYTIFIYIIYYMQYRLKGSFRSYLVLSILLAFTGAQIQFFLIAYIFVFMFFLFKIKAISWKYSALLLIIPIAINSVWIANFVTGGSDITSISSNAAAASFKASSSTSFINIFTFLFSKGTLLSNYFTLFELLGSSTILIITLYLVTKAKKTKDILFLFCYLLVMIFFSTGLFQLIDIKPFNTLYPMFREVGHFAPLVILFSIIIIAKLLKLNSKKTILFVSIIALLIISINASKFIIHAQAINYTDVRSSFKEFKDNDNKNSSDNFRILSYPFFGQYTLKSLPVTYYNGLPAMNTGHDSYSTFSNNNYIYNAVKSQDFKNSLQYKLLQSYDLNLLKPYNVKYIYDFSSIYQSNVDKYISPSVYANDLSIIKNNPNFIANLISHNPGKLKKVGNNILEITDYSEHVYATNELASVPSSSLNQHTINFLESTSPTKNSDYTSTSTNIATRAVSQLFTNSNNDNYIKNNKLNQAFTLAGNEETTLYKNSTPSELRYELRNSTLHIYATKASVIEINGKSEQNKDNAVTILDLPILDSTTYYLKVDDRVFTISSDDNNRTLTNISTKSSITLFKSEGVNLIKNNSFELGPWKQKVSDCNNFDSHENISMSINSNESTDGIRSLNLSANNHIACTSTTFDASSLNNYLVSFDYKSPNSTAATLYTTFNLGGIGDYTKSYFPDDNKWHGVQTIITSPERSTIGGIFLHANPDNNDTKHADVSYDNIKVNLLEKIQDITSAEAITYKQSKITDKSIEFTYSDAFASYKNLVSNSTFNKDLWQDKVSDCNNYDSNPSINMSNPISNGSPVLQLSATRHSACTFTTVAIDNINRAILKYSYKAKKNSQYGYLLVFNDKNKTQYKQSLKVAVSDTWSTDTAIFDPPKDATAVKIYLYAYEGNGISANTIQYDNIQFISIPNTDGESYIETKNSNILSSPKKINYIKYDNTEYEVKVSSASTPFYLNLSESYHPKWNLYIRTRDNKLVAIDKNSHYSLNDYSNGWYIDTDSICAKNVNCQKNSDNSYNLNIEIVFEPQKWFLLASRIGILTIIISVICIARPYLRKPVWYKA